MRINVATQQILDKILQRKRRDEYGSESVDLRQMLKEILLWANRFVPSQSGSILLDDPTLNPQREKLGVLYFVACFGRGSTALVGTSLPVNVGIVGRTYTSGKPYISKKAKEDSFFYSAIDKKTKFSSKSIVCAPIKIKGVTVGVIELINRSGSIDYSPNDLTLLKIFAEYTSTLIQNSLDAKRFAELSIRDNLTGLYNDRHFYDCLNKELARALKSGGDLSLLFLDLDHFKEVNDTYGHLAGSGVLTEIGTIINESVAGTGAISARYGGDEFVIIFPGTDIDRVSLYAERIRRSIEEFVFLKRRGDAHGKALKIKGVITSSIGVASLRANVAPGGTAPEIRETLIKQADTAMYTSKRVGKNTVTRAPGKAVA